jgi:hypothetical protein
MKVNITLNSDPPSFGCISAGFVYKLKLSITNCGASFDRFRITIRKNDEEDPNAITSNFPLTNIAPGMSAHFDLDLRAEGCYETTYTMLITSANTTVSESKVISALVIPQDTFKKVAKALILRNKGIYAPYVYCIGQLSGESAQRSMISGAPTIYSESLIDDDELEVAHYSTQLADLNVFLGTCRSSYFTPNLLESFREETLYR